MRADGNDVATGAPARRVPQSGKSEVKKTLKKWIGHTFIKAAGWKLEGEAPTAPRYVVIAAPHTSNWDLPFMLAASYIYDMPMHWMGKHTLFKPPYGPFMKWLGGVPIDRSAPGGAVGQFVDVFQEMADRDERWVLSVPAEGTRSLREFWKSGFYHIAAGANVPIALSYLDWGTKTTGIGKMLIPSGDLDADMDEIRAFYAGMQGKFPDRFTAPLLREESSVREGAETVDGADTDTDTDDALAQAS